MSISSDEVNYLVYRYLQESGFSHAAFLFAHESLIARSVIADAEVPAGALLAFLQKGLAYVEIESHLQEDGVERACDEPFHLITPHVCRLRVASAKDGGAAAAVHADGGAAAIAAAEAAPADVTLLTGHGAEAYAVAWTPRAPSGGAALASCGADATARLWRVDSGAGVSAELPVVLRHGNAATEGGRTARGADGGDVSALDWSPDCGRLATAGSDGRARIWTNAGVLIHTLAQHVGPINALQWSPNGNMLATVGGACFLFRAKTGVAWLGCAQSGARSF